MATYIKNIYPTSTDSHQTSPGYMLTFIRWSNRDTFNYEGSNTEVRTPLVVINDAVSVSVSNSKTGTTPSMSATLLAGDINYATAIHPGDFVYVNMVNWEDKIARVDTTTGNDINGNSLRNRALGVKPINNYHDGFKGLFKVQTVRKRLVTDPASGTKTLAYTVQAFGFTEFNNVIYYDPQVYNFFTGSFKMFQQQFDKFWSNIVKDKKTQSLQSIMQLLINALIGQGTKKINSTLPANPNAHYIVPTTVGRLMGVKAKFASDIYNYVFGIWGDSRVSKISDTAPGEGFNPNIKRDSSQNAGFFKTPTQIDGHKVVEAEFWNGVRVWDILQKYLNSTINEMYTAYRVNPNNRVMPTLVVRQKPFTSLHFVKGKEFSIPLKDKIETQNVTRFLRLPRWKISPNLLYDMDLGKDDAARINFVQIKTRSIATNQSRDLARQTGLKNFVPDTGDIARNGLRPYLTTANFDYPENTKKTKGKEWAQLVSDWLINGHLREAGTLTFVGIEDPIEVGDNIELDGIVYHIDAVNHTMRIDSNGKKQFRTKLQVSFGTDLRSSATQPVYPQMEHTDTFTERIEDFANDRMMPGFSDTQNIGGRIAGEEIRETKQKSFTLKPKKRQKSNEPNSGENVKTHTEQDAMNDILDPTQDTKIPFKK